MPRQAFRLSPDAFNASNSEEIVETVKVMKQLGIFKLPYADIDIIVPLAKLITSSTDTEQRRASRTPTYIRFEGHEPAGIWLDEGPNGIRGQWYPFSELLRISNTEHFTVEKYNEVELKLHNYWKDLLIVLLVTKNAIKETKHNKLGKLGIGKLKHEYVTTISIGKPINDPSEPVTPGKAKCPHLRRGHVKSQRYGPNFQFSKLIFIEPCFVNGDRDWVSTRTAYNVSKYQPSGLI